MYVAVNQRRPVRELLGDTTVRHEFVHLIMPYIHPDDAWCREGFATYYETILPARMGRISPDYAWKLLHRGFEKGRRQIMDMTLFEASRKMYTVNTRDWVYWGGAPPQ